MPPNEVPIRLNRVRPKASAAAAIVVARSWIVCVRWFSAEPKPGISNAITRKARLSRSCADVSRSPPAPCR